MHPGFSGIVPLENGHDALAARIVLADAAERSIDARAYIWRNDTSGKLIAGALYRAAERGVRVRLLLDDNNTVGLDSVLAAFDAHPSIEVRLFNPNRFRRLRILGYLTNFSRMNRRMHNKSFTVDGQATIIGGRNVGDEYFDVGDGISFADLDVMAVGSVVGDVDRDFERYWSSAPAMPAGRVLARASAGAVAGIRATLLGLPHTPVAQPYLRAIGESPLVHDLLRGGLSLEWAPTTMLSDDPAKGLALSEDAGCVSLELERMLASATRELLLVSAYFVPGTQGVALLTGCARHGVEIDILTNALEATDVGVVHAGYAKRREPLLRAGARIFEMRRSYAPPRVRRGKRPGRKGSSRASLHAKTFSVDRSRVFLGSFNFDPRSARLNTEMGFVIDSPALATAIAEAFVTDVPERSYEVRLSDSGALTWIIREEGREIVVDREPGVGPVRRFCLHVLAALPVEWLL
jgi:putative cardiolipin synthase